MLWWPIWVSASSPLADVVERYVAAYNDQDVERMLEHASTDIRWMSVSESDVHIEANGVEELRSAMVAFFGAGTGIRSRLLSVSESGLFVHTVEAAIWSSENGIRSQCSMAVYEMSGRKIQNVWYFPAYPCP